MYYYLINIKWLAHAEITINDRFTLPSIPVNIENITITCTLNTTECQKLICLKLIYDFEKSIRQYYTSLPIVP